MAKQVKALTAKEVNGIYELKWYCGTNKVLWNSILEKVKLIPGRFPDKDSKGKFIWKVPINTRTTQLLTELGFRIKVAPPVEAPRKKVKLVIPQEYKKEVLRDVDPRLRSYQLDGVKFWQYHNFNAANFDDMGTGKTCQSLSAIRTSGIRPALIVVPFSLKLNFAKEAKMWLNKNDQDKVHVVHGMLNMWYKDADIVIINYDLLWKHLEYILREFRPEIVVADEAHLLKGCGRWVSKYYPDRPMKSNEEVRIVDDKKAIYNKDPQRVTAMQYLVNGLPLEMVKQANLDWEGIEHFMPMTGTPITKHPGDLFNILQMLERKRFQHRDKFEDYFCVQGEGFKAGTKKITGAKNTDILNSLLYKKYAIRRTKKQVLKELPDTIKTVIPLPLDSKTREQYDEADANFMTWLETNKDNETVTDKVRKQRFKVLMDLATEGKLKESFAFIDNILKTTKEKVLIFSYNTWLVDAVVEKYGKKAVKLDGSCSAQQREEAVERFQNDPKIRVFSGQINAATVGITLVASHICVFLQTGWWAHLVSQGIDRLNRMGQKASNVLAYFLQGDDTIESYILKKLDREQAMIDSIVDGKDMQEEDMLSYLWDEYKKRLNNK